MEGFFSNYNLNCFLLSFLPMKFMVDILNFSPVFFLRIQPNLSSLKEYDERSVRLIKIFFRKDEIKDLLDLVIDK